MDNSLNRDKVSVIGGAGFIGSCLVQQLILAGYQVTVIDDFSTGDLLNLKEVVDSPLLEIYRSDVDNCPSRIAGLIAGSSHVFHLAAKTSVEESMTNPVEYFETNFLGTITVIEAMKLANVKHLIFSSTSAVYGETSLFPTGESVKPNPISPYAMSKIGRAHV